MWRCYCLKVTELFFPKPINIELLVYNIKENDEYVRGKWEMLANIQFQSLERRDNLGDLGVDGACY
jgi:hypothetical protein